MSITAHLNLNLNSSFQFTIIKFPLQINYLNPNLSQSHLISISSRCCLISSASESQSDISTFFSILLISSLKNYFQHILSALSMNLTELLSFGFQSDERALNSTWWPGQVWWWSCDLGGRCDTG